MIERRTLIKSMLYAPAIIRTPGLLMPIRPLVLIHPLAGDASLRKTVWAPEYLNGKFTGYFIPITSQSFSWSTP